MSHRLGTFIMDYLPQVLKGLNLCMDDVVIRPRYLNIGAANSVSDGTSGMISIIIDSGDSIHIESRDGIYSPGHGEEENQLIHHAGFTAKNNGSQTETLSIIQITTNGRD